MVLANWEGGRQARVVMNSVQLKTVGPLPIIHKLLGVKKMHLKEIVTQVLMMRFFETPGS